MTRSHAPRAATTAAALGVLALAGCGSTAEQAPEAAAATRGAASASSTIGTRTSTSPTPTASPSRAATGGIDDPATGIDGTQPGGTCTWVTAEQVGALASARLKDPVQGIIAQQPIRGYPGTLRFCRFSLGTRGESMTIGSLAFESAADLRTFLKEALSEPGSKTVPGMQGATYFVLKSPVDVGQSIQVVDGTRLRYITARYEGDTAKIVDNEPVPSKDRLPDLKAMYLKVFG